MLKQTMISRTLFSLPTATTSELAALHTGAHTIATALGLDETALRASLLASEVQATHFAGEAVAVCRASCAELTAPRTVSLILPQAVRWGAGAGRPVQQLIVLLVPTASGETAVAAALTRIQAKVAAGLPLNRKAQAAFVRDLLA